MPERIIDLIKQQLALVKQIKEQEKRRKDFEREEAQERERAMHARNNELLEEAKVLTLFEKINQGLLCGKGEITHLPSQTISIRHSGGGHDSDYYTQETFARCNLSWSMITDTPLQNKKSVSVSVEAVHGDEVKIEASNDVEVEKVYSEGVVGELDTRSMKWRPKRNKTLANAVEESVAKKISEAIIRCQNMGFYLSQE